MKVEYFEGHDGQWRFRVVGGNNEIMVSSEGYAGGKTAAERGFQDLLGVMVDFWDSQD